MTWDQVPLEGGHCKPKGYQSRHHRVAAGLITHIFYLNSHTFGWGQMGSSSLAGAELNGVCLCDFQISTPDRTFSGC